MRQLTWAAQARRVEQWDLAASLQSWLARGMTGEQIDPLKLNPWRQARAASPGPPGPLEDAAAWALLDTCFGK